MKSGNNSNSSKYQEIAKKLSECHAEYLYIKEQQTHWKLEIENLDATMFQKAASYVKEMKDYESKRDNLAATATEIKIQRKKEVKAYEDKTTLKNSELNNLS